MIVRLSWSEGAPSQQGDGFRVYRSVNGGSYTLIATLPLSQTTYDDSNVSYGNVYRYRVVEYKGSNESTPAEICVGLLGYTEAAAATDALRKRPRRTRTEAAAVTDALGKRPRRTWTETTTATDALGKRPRRSPGETVSLSEEAARSLAREYLEACYTGDARSPFTLSRALPESLVLTDLRTGGLARSLEDVVPLGDVCGERGLVREFEEWELADDGDNRAIARELHQLVSLGFVAERLPTSFAREHAEAAPLGHELGRWLGRHSSEELTLDLAWARGLIHAFLDEADVSHAAWLPLNLAREIPEDAGLTEAWARGLLRPPWAEEVLPSVLCARGLSRPFLEAQGVAEFILSRSLVREEDEALELADALPFRGFSRLYLEALPTGDGMGRALGKLAVGSISLEELFVRALARALLEEAGAGDAVERSLARALAEASALEALLSQRSYCITFLEAPLVFARLAVPGRSTPFPWDTGQGGLFLERLRRALEFAKLARELRDEKLGRDLVFSVLLRELLTGRRKRDLTMSKPLR